MIDVFNGYKHFSSSDLKEMIRLYKRNLKGARENQDNDRATMCEAMITGCKGILNERKKDSK